MFFAIQVWSIDGRVATCMPSLEMALSKNTVVVSPLGGVLRKLVFKVLNLYGVGSTCSALCAGFLTV